MDWYDKETIGMTQKDGLLAELTKAYGTELKRARAGAQTYRECLATASPTLQNILHNPREQDTIAAMFLGLTPACDIPLPHVLLFPGEVFTPEEEVANLQIETALQQLPPPYTYIRDNLNFTIFDPEAVKKIITKYPKVFPGYTADMDLKNYLYVTTLQEKNKLLREERVGYLSGYPPHAIADFRAGGVDKAKFPEVGVEMWGFRYTVKQLTPADQAFKEKVAFLYQQSGIADLLEQKPEAPSA